jgi:cellulose synthase/poly-beta-1,6-N-acetylglucosamine synthase-like glycosyltransferase|tara:strand:+ start:8477 stop:9484 length:1008 start_codon:yes stop_codon:yes gene_type:complete
LKSEPFVSIVIPTTGNVKFIRGLVESVIELDYPKDKFELILIGDKNTDLIEKHSKIAIKNGINTLLIFEPVPAGQKRNIGSEKAKGDLIAFTDDDTILREDWIRNAVKHLRQNEEHVGVGGPNFTPRQGLPFAKAVGRIFGSKFLFSFRYTIGHAKAREIAHNPTCNYIIKKDIVKKIKFHPNLWPGEDVEFDIRVLKAGHKILYSPDVVVWHHRRSRPRAFLEQMFNYGKTRAQVTRMHPSSFDIRYFAFVLAFTFLMSLYSISYLNIEIFNMNLNIKIPLFLNGAYFAILGLAGLLVGYQTKNIKQTIYAPLVLFIQHFGFSLGLLYGFLTKP